MIHYKHQTVYCNLRLLQNYTNIRLRYPVMWRRVIWLIGTDVSEEHSVYCFKLEYPAYLPYQMQNIARMVMKKYGRILIWKGREHMG